jgi:predicted nucleic acid-binding protein
LGGLNVERPWSSRSTVSRARSSFRIREKRLARSWRASFGIYSPRRKRRMPWKPSSKEWTMPAGGPSILIDSSIWIKGQRDPKWFESVVSGQNDVATCDAAVGEFEVGLYAPRQERTREKVREFFNGSISRVMCLPHLPDDFREAARLIGDAIFNSAAKPSFPDGLIAACARRTGRTVWTTDETDFKAMGCQTCNPWLSLETRKHPITDD